MNVYLARVVQRDGVVRYLGIRGVLVKDAAKAMTYASPEAARKELDAWSDGVPPWSFHADVIDSDSGAPVAE